MFDDWKYLKIIYVHCGAVKKWDISDPRSYEHYWTSKLNETWKKFRPVKNFKSCTGVNFFQVSFQLLFQ